jgi:hypothetical protein
MEHEAHWSSSEVDFLAVPVVIAVFVLALFWLNPILFIALILTDLGILLVLGFIILSGWHAADRKTSGQILAVSNAAKLRQYVGEMAYVIHAEFNWALGRVRIVEVRNDVVFLFKPAWNLSVPASAVLVHCEDLRVIEMAASECVVQLRVLGRQLKAIGLGPVSKWEDREKQIVAPRPRGNIAFRAEFSQAGSSMQHEISIYAPVERNPDYTLVTVLDGKETSIQYGNNVEISKKFAVIQIDYRARGFRYVGAQTGESPDPLYLSTP